MLERVAPLVPLKLVGHIALTLGAGLRVERTGGDSVTRRKRRLPRPPATPSGDI